jgi:hypothetical protein
VNDDDSNVALDVAHFKDDRGCVGTDHHGEAFAEIPDANWVSIGIQDVVLGQSVLEGSLSNDGVFRHGYKITCPLTLGNIESVAGRLDGAARRGSWGE